MMRTSLGSHRLVQRGGVLPRPPAGTLFAARRPRLACIRSAAVEDSVEEAAPAAADASAALTPAAEPAGAEPAAPKAAPKAAPEAAPEAAPSAAKQGTSAGRGRVGRLKVTNTIDCTASARYLMSALVEQPSTTSICMSAIGQQACLNAFKILARASEMVQQQDSSSCLTFQPLRKLVPANEEGKAVAVVMLYVRCSPAEAFSEDPDTPRSSHPMSVRSDTEASRITAHALYAANNRDSSEGGGPSAFFQVSGGILAPKVRRLLDGLTKAQHELKDGETDLTFTISRSMYEVKQDSEAAGQQQQQDGQAASAGGAEEEADEVAQGDEASAAASSSASSSSNQGSSNTQGDSNQPVMRPAYLLKAFTFNRRPSAAPRSSSRDGSSRKPAAAGAARAGPRRGYVEVPAEEWAQLKEQLEVVPHLTEQLQIMTRQHEQLLSLLEAQGALAEQQQ